MLREGSWGISGNCWGSPWSRSLFPGLLKSCSMGGYRQQFPSAVCHQRCYCCFLGSVNPSGLDWWPPGFLWLSSINVRECRLRRPGEWHLVFSSWIQGGFGGNCPQLPAVCPPPPFSSSWPASPGGGSNKEVAEDGGMLCLVKSQAGCDYKAPVTVETRWGMWWEGFWCPRRCSGTAPTPSTHIHTQLLMQLWVAQLSAQTLTSYVPPPP